MEVLYPVVVWVGVLVTLGTEVELEKIGLHDWMVLKVIGYLLTFWAFGLLRNDAQTHPVASFLAPPSYPSLR